MKYFILFSFLLIDAATGQVKHAPTVAQCQADERLWVSDVEHKTDDTLPSLRILSDWGVEMEDCRKVDPDNQRSYFNLSSEIIALRLTRISHFLDRHNLYQQFIQEDEEGKR
jgi:hypothetical protein